MDMPESLQGKHTVTVSEAAKVLGVGSGQIYDAVKRGEFPALRLGGRILVPVPKLLALLGYSDAAEQEVHVPQAPPSIEGVYEVTVRRVSY